MQWPWVSRLTYDRLLDLNSRLEGERELAQSALMASREAESAMWRRIDETLTECERLSKALAAEKKRARRRETAAAKPRPAVDAGKITPAETATAQATLKTFLSDRHDKRVAEGTEETAAFPPEVAKAIKDTAGGDRALARRLKQVAWTRIAEEVAPKAIASEIRRGQEVDL